MVWASTKVSNYIDWILNYSKNNLNAIRCFYESFEELHHHLSFRSVGLGYGIPNPFTELGLSVQYNLKYDINGQPYINIYRIRIDFDYFGLSTPSAYRNPIQERINRVAITESQLRSIIRETIRRVLLTA